MIDESLEAKLSREIYHQRRLEVGNATANARTDDLEDEELLGYEPILPGLPPASSDRRKWWLNNGRFHSSNGKINTLTRIGLPARSDIGDAKDGYIPNPRQPPNPFSPSNEPEWVVVRNSSTDHNNQRKPFAGIPSSNPKEQPLSDYVHVDSADATAIGAPLARIDSKASSTSSTTGVKRKPAPPIPRKPPLLASTSHRPDSRGEISIRMRPLPSKESDEEAQMKPALPARLPGSAVTGTGLMDEEDDHARSIPSLEPLRPR